MAAAGGLLPTGYSAIRKLITFDFTSIVKVVCREIVMKNAAGFIGYLVVAMSIPVPCLSATMPTDPATGLPLFVSESKPGGRSIKSMGKRAEGRVTFTTAKLEGPVNYTVCSTGVIEHHRDPRWRAPADDYAGYRLIQNNPTVVSYQWWVMPWRKAFDRRHIVLDATFWVEWIHKNASKEQHDACDASEMTTLPPRTWPVPMPGGGGGSNPPPSEEYYVYLELQCVNNETNEHEGTREIRGESNNSCADAQRDAEQFANAADRCRTSQHITMPWHEQSRQSRRWIPTLPCR